MKEERLERNRKWRERKEGREILEDEEKELDEKEKRKLKNKEWRLKRERVDSDEVGEMLETVSRPMLMAGVLAELSCAGCHREMLDLEIWQCEEGHSLCPSCRDLQDQDFALCPLCSQPILGLNYALMAVAQILSGGKCEESEEGSISSSSMDITLKAPEDEEDSLDFAEPAMDSLVEMKDI